METADRIRALRIRAGKSRLEMAQSLGLNSAWYDDLEQREGELAATLNVFQAMQLASLLGVRLHELFDAGAPAHPRIPLIDLPERILAHATGAGISVEQLEREVGWDLRDFLDAPVQVAAELPLAFLMAIASPLGIDWLSLAPEDDADTGAG